MMISSRYKTIIILLVILLVGNILIHQNVNAAKMSVVERVAGPSEMETAINIALKLNPGIAPAVILVGSNNYFEALAAIPLGSQKEAPILWVGSSPEESEAVFDFIDNHIDKSGQIYILGNHNSIPVSFEKPLKELGYEEDQIVRLGEVNHYETAVKIVRMVENKSNQVIISSGDDYSQLAGIAAMAVAEESPILFLSSKESIPKGVIDYLDALDTNNRITIQVIGDNKSVPYRMISELRSKLKTADRVVFKRITGNDPYDLMAKVNKIAWLTEIDEDEKRTPISSINLTSGGNYVEGIAGAVLAAKIKAPLVFIDDEIPKGSVRLLKDIYKWNKQLDISNRKVTVLGDSIHLSEKLVAEVDSLLSLGEFLDGSPQVWTYAQAYLSSELNYGVVGESDSIIVTDGYLNTLHNLNKDKDDIILTDTSEDQNEYGRPLGGYKDGLVAKSRYDSPSGIAMDKQGTLYIADTGNGVIRRIGQDGRVKAIAKGLKYPTGIVLNSKGDIFIAETLEHRIIKIDAHGKQTVLAGGGYITIDNQPVGAFADGRGEKAKFNEPRGLAIDDEDNIYVADTANQRIRKVSPEGLVTTIAGSGFEYIKNTSYILGGYQDGEVGNAKFNFPQGLALGPDKTIYVADTYNHLIRRISPEGVVSTLTGNSEPGNRNGNANLAQFKYPSDVVPLGDERLIIVDKGNALLRVYEPGKDTEEIGVFMASQSEVTTGNSLATFDNISGGVFVRKAGGLKELKAINGMDINQGDSVRTDTDGAANIIYASQSKMTVGSNALFSIDKLKKTKAIGMKISITLESGSLWNSVKSLTNIEDEYEIVTKGLASNVKGTMFLVGVDPATGELTLSVFDGAIANNVMRVDDGSQGVMQPMGYSMQYSLPVPPPSVTRPLTAPPPPVSSPAIDMGTIVGGEHPLILANIAMDSIDRLQELQLQSRSNLSAYQDTRNKYYLQGTLRLSQLNTLLGDVGQQYMNAIQGTSQEHMIDQILQQQNRTIEDIRQQVEQLNNEAQQLRHNAVEAARQAGINPDQIQRYLQNAPTSSGEARPGSYQPIQPPPPPPPTLPSIQPPSIPLPSIPSPSIPSPSIPLPSIQPPSIQPPPLPPLPPPLPISDLGSSEITSNSAVLTWSTIQNPEHVKLQYSYDNVGWSDYNQVYSIMDRTSITVNGLSPNTRYDFRIMVSEGPNRGSSNIISLTTDMLKLTGIGDITGIARVGETLTAGIVTPDTATVTYQWQIADTSDGSYVDIRGQNAVQYVISKTDVNKYIRLLATGTGDYTNNVISDPTEAVTEIIPTPISWSLPEPSVSVNTDGNTNNIVIEFTANQGGEIYYMILDDNLLIGDILDFKEYTEVKEWVISGKKEFYSAEPDRIEIPYSEVIHANKGYMLYMVLKGADDSYSEVKQISFSTPKDSRPPVLTSSVENNSYMGGLSIYHSAVDYDELYKLYVWIFPQEQTPNSKPNAQEVKNGALFSQREYSYYSGNTLAMEVIYYSDLFPETEYIVYIVAQDNSDVGVDGEGLFSDVVDYTVTTPFTTSVETN